MSKRWYITKIQPENFFIKWDGTNLDEFNEQANPAGFTFAENVNGGLDAVFENNVVYFTIPLGNWYRWGDHGAASYSDPFQAHPQHQEVPGPGLYEVKLGGFTHYEQ